MLKFVRYFLGVMLGVLLIYAPSSHAQTAGVEIKSENFVLMGDVSQREGKRLVKDLEIFRLSLFKMLKLKPEPEAVPVQIFAFKNKNQFQSFVRNKTVGGVYKKGTKGPMFVLDAQGGFKEGDPARKIALHEYVKSKFIIGAPDRNYFLYLTNADWMSMDVLIGSVNRYPFQSGSTKSSQRNMQSAFYAQSWLAVTYLQTHPEYARKSADYLNRVNKKENSIEAFNTVFGQSPEEFGATLKKFVKKDYFLHYPFPLNDNEKNPKMSAKKLNQADFESKVTQARVNFITN